jgi:hypothetical protein
MQEPAYVYTGVLDISKYFEELEASKRDTAIGDSVPTEEYISDEIEKSMDRSDPFLNEEFITSHVPSELEQKMDSSSLSTESYKQSFQSSIDVTPSCLPNIYETLFSVTS